ncbi:MAG: DUF3570 domain-containing protein [Lentisphaerae bacterium]|nr:DUF3570 domain-containing protein [Lentisphaerota bacterium]
MPLCCAEGVYRTCRNRLAAPLILTAVLYLAPMRRGRAEERLDLKTLYYQETDNRIQVIAPSAQLEKELSETLTIRIDGVYNAISGATPTGAPPPHGNTATATETVVVPAPDFSDRRDDDERDGDGESEEEGVNRLLDRLGGDRSREDRLTQRLGRVRGATLPRYFARAGATPKPAPAPSPSPSPSPTPAAASPSGTGTPITRTTTPTTPGVEVPKQDIEDTRVGTNVELIKRLGRHTPSGMVSFSSESDYVSWGLALRDAIDFNQKNTTLLVGGAGNFDTVEGAFLTGSEKKKTYDVLLGVTQLIDPKTFVTANLGLGYASGYLNDPYKVAEVNGVLVPEKRPDSKDKQMVYLALNHFVDSLQGSAEGSYRYYQDSFGISGHTLGVAWYQKLGAHVVLRPAVRYYMQSAADFYGVWFTGDPAYYSSDYRVSEFDSVNYGLKAIWSPNDRLSFDAAYERYDQQGQDGVTVQDAYTTANYIIVGMRIWL